MKDHGSRGGPGHPGDVQGKGNTSTLLFTHSVTHTLTDSLHTEIHSRSRSSNRVHRKQEGFQEGWGKYNDPMKNITDM